MNEKPSAASSRPERPVRKSASDIRAYRKSPKFLSDVERLREHTAPFGGEPTPVDLAAMPEWTDEELAAVEAIVPKQAVTMRLDTDVVAWLKEGGPKYQTRANAYLRSAMKAARRRRKDREANNEQQSNIGQ